MSDTRRRQPSVPLSGRVVSAARAEPLEDDDDEYPSGVPNRLRSGAENTALNAFAELRERWEDFRGKDRFFKYKALIVSSWLLLSAAALWTARPSPSVVGNSRLGARLVIGANPERPIFTVFNESDASWADVIVLINHEFSGGSPLVEPNGYLSLTPTQLMGKNGRTPPSDLKASEIELRTRSGSATLLSGGKAD